MCNDSFMQNTRRNFATLIAGLMVVVAVFTSPASAQQAGRVLNVDESGMQFPDKSKSPLNPDGRSEFVPSELQNVGVDEKPGAAVPLDLTFTNERGDTVKLADLALKDRPIVLQLSYFECPMLCELVSRGMVKAMNELKLDMGRDFTVINVSFDPNDKFPAAALKKDAYLKAYDAPDRGGGSWHFLVGSAQNVDTLTKAVGFNYKWVSEANQFSHPAVLYVLTADGRISNYVYGAQPSAKVLKRALVEAGQGKIGTVMDRFFAICFHVSGDGKYTPRAYLLMRMAGVLTVIGIVTVVSMLLNKEMNLRRATGVAGGLKTTSQAIEKKSEQS